VSSSGAVYVTNRLGGTVVVYQPGSTTPSTVWQSPIANYALVGIALQNPAGGNVYVSYESPSGSGILHGAVGSAACSGTGLAVALPFALAFQYNTSPQNLLASDLSGNVIDVFHLRHGTLPAVQFRTPGNSIGNGLNAPFGVAIGSGLLGLEALYVTNPLANSLSVFLVAPQAGASIVYSVHGIFSTLCLTCRKAWPRIRPAESGSRTAETAASPSRLIFSAADCLR
jgi:hypothetical protein